MSGRRWWAEAACSDTPKDVFFPERIGVHNVKPALAICATCPVADECLEDVLAFEEGKPERYGVAGGHTPRERDEIARARTLLSADLDVGIMR